MTSRSARAAELLPTISIVTPNLNAAEFLGETMESVLEQDYPALQYVVADGGSSDRSMEIVRQYRDRLHGVIHEPDEGHADAINRGFSLTSGEVMGWLNSDDVLHPGALATVGAVFAAFPDINWITGRPTLAIGGGAAGPTRMRRRPGRKFTYGDFLAGDYRWLQQESTFWRRSLWEKAGGSLDGRLHLAVDLELWMRFFRHARLSTVGALLGAFRRRDGQRSAIYLKEYLAEAEAVIARERQMVRSGEVVVAGAALRRSADGRLPGRIMRRLRLPSSPPDISRSDVRKALEGLQQT